MSSDKLRETFDVILGGERAAPSARPPAAGAVAAPVRAFAGSEADDPPTSGREIPSLEADRYIALAEGGFFYPNIISDYVMRDLSLGEQSVFHRLLRLSQGLDTVSDKVRIPDVAEACGLTPEFTARAMRSLQEKGLLHVVRHHRLSRSVRYKLDVLKQWQGKLVLCAVCHGPIRPEEEHRLVEVARSSRGCQEVPIHERCLDG
jgi:hypothetical protein